jgi:uncharacterized membrane protein YkvA (DUF1232 family)
MGRMLQRWKARAAALKLEVLTLFLACRDSRTPNSAKVLLVGIVGYTLSPLDLIPDPVPLVGYLDDLGVLLLGLALLPRMIPPAILADCRAQAQKFPATPMRWVATGILIANLLLTALAVGYFARRMVG